MVEGFWLFGVSMERMNLVRLGAVVESLVMKADSWSGLWVRVMGISWFELLGKLL